MLSCTRVKKETTCTRTKLMETQKIQFSLFKCNFFCFSIFIPVLSLPSTLKFQSDPSKQSPTFLLPAKRSSPSPLQNHHHRRRATVGFWRTKQSLVKVSLTSISPSPPARFHHFFGPFFYFIFVFSFDDFVFTFNDFVFIFNDFVFKFSVFFGCLD